MIATPDKTGVAGQERRTSVLTVGNQKGGVAKSTLANNLCAALGERGRKVLLWDLDMNHGSTRNFGIDPEVFLGTYEILTGAEEPENVILTNEEPDVELPENVHLIPASRKLEDIDEVLTTKKKFLVRHNALIEPITRLRGTYDYIVLDTAPNATTPTLASYICTDFFILSAIPEPRSIDGLGDALRDIEDAKQVAGRPLNLLGVALSAVNTRTNLARALRQYVEEFFTVNDRCLKFETEISVCTYIPAAQKIGKTVLQTHPKHKVSDQYRALAAEVEERVNEFHADSEPTALERVEALAANE